MRLRLFLEMFGPFELSLLLLSLLANGVRFGLVRGWVCGQQIILKTSAVGPASLLPRDALLDTILAPLILLGN